MSKVDQRLLMGAILAFVVGFVATVATRSQTSEPVSPASTSPLAQWLHFDKEQSAAVDEHDPQFPKEVRKLREALAEERGRLIALFENVDTPNDDLRQQINTVIETHNQLEWRVADYLLTVRHHLTPAQQQRLFSLCAENVRYCWREQRWRQGRGQGGATCSCGGNCQCRPNNDGALSQPDGSKPDDSRQPANMR